MNKAINDKIQELFQATPNDISVCYGRKITDGKYTDELAFVFMVEKKLPLDQIPEDKILPSTINIEGVTYKTDVIATEEFKLITAPTCSTPNPTVQNQCYLYSPFTTASSPNSSRIRPLKGGIQVTSANLAGSVGTLGFLALDTTTSALVGVSNNHVLVKNAFFTNERVGNNTTIQNELDDNVYQNGNYIESDDLIGKVMRYVPISAVKPNQVDGALIALYSDTVSNAESYLQFGLPTTLPMEFATTTEINNALTGNYPLASSGRTTGAKISGTACAIAMHGLNTTSYISFKNNGANVTTLFNQLITFSRVDPTCPYPVYSGDSGSALLAFIKGQWKIFGLVFALSGDGMLGVACRIDQVASQLGIKPWSGIAVPFINVDSKQVKAVYNTSGEKLLNCGGKVYWQVGNDNNTNYCS